MKTLYLNSLSSVDMMQTIYHYTGTAVSVYNFIYIN